MAEILLNFFDNIILATAVEEVVPAVGFFKDRYFPTGAGDIFKADKVITEYRDGDRKRDELHGHDGREDEHRNAGERTVLRGDGRLGAGLDAAEHLLPCSAGEDAGHHLGVVEQVIHQVEEPRHGEDQQYHQQNPAPGLFHLIQLLGKITDNRLLTHIRYNTPVFRNIQG